jgi:hypothetical protein
MKLTEERLADAKVARCFVAKRQATRDVVISIALFLGLTFSDGRKLGGGQE